MSQAWHEHLNNLSTWEQIDRFFFPSKYSCTLTPNIIEILFLVFFTVLIIILIIFVIEKIYIHLKSNSVNKDENKMSEQLQKLEQLTIEANELSKQLEKYYPVRNEIVFKKMFKELKKKYENILSEINSIEEFLRVDNPDDA